MAYNAISARLPALRPSLRRAGRKKTRDDETWRRHSHSACDPGLRVDLLPTHIAFVRWRYWSRGSAQKYCHIRTRRLDSLSTGDAHYQRESTATSPRDNFAAPVAVEDYPVLRRSSHHGCREQENTALPLLL